MQANTKAHLAVLTTNFLFGINYAAMKFVVPSHIQPIALNMARVSTALILFWVLYLFNPSKIAIKKKHILRFIVCALTGVVFNQLLFVKGLSLTTSIHASLLSLGTPIFITFIAAWVLKERLSLPKITGLVLGVSGAAILILMKDSSHIGKNVLWGDLMILLNAISYAFYMVLVRPLMQEYSPVSIIRWIFTFGFIIMLPFALPSFMHTPWQTFQTGHWLTLLLICIGATFVAYLFNIYGIAVIGASATGSYIYTQPVFAAIVAIVLMGEHLNMYKIVSAVLIFSGVYLVNRKKST
jgi:drug/metabolite transporter (DMT)-like permease